MPSPAARTTAFVLTEDQERELVEYALQRAEGLKVDNNERIAADKKGWDWFRNCRKERVAENTVFEQSNLVLPLTSMIVQSFIARAEDEVTGSSPFFRFRPKGKSDAAKAKQFNGYFEHKFGPDGADVKRTFEDAYEAVFVQRCAVFKVHWADQTARWLDPKVKILTNRIDGKPVRKLAAGKAGYVTEDEATWVEQPGLGPDGMTPTMKSVLADDPSIVWNADEMEFRPPPKSLLREQVIYQGAKAKLLDYDSFICPNNAPSIAEADFKGEIYDKPLSWVKSMFIERPWMTWRMFSAKHRTNKAKPQSQTDRNTESKEGLEFDEKTRSVKLLELWVKRDVLGWGKPQEFMLLVDPEERVAVFYEFVSNICPDHRDPYVGIAIAPTKGRWWGYNLPELIEQYQDFSDKQFNRTAVRNGVNANPIGVYDPKAVEEEPDQIELGDGGLYRKKTGKTLADFVEFANIPDADFRTIELLDFVIRMLQLWLSVSNLSQGDIESVPKETTKYAAEAALQESSKLGRRWIRRIIRGFELVLRKMVKLQTNNLDHAEVYELLEGEVGQLLEMTPEELQGVDLDVTIVMGTQLTATEVAAAEKALEVQDRYNATPDPLKERARPLLSRILEALGYDDVDTLLPLPVMAPPLALPGAEMAGVPPVEGGIAA